MKENTNTNTKITKKTEPKNGSKNLIKNDKSLTEYFTSDNQNMGNSERVVSTVAGGSLVAYGIKRKDWLGALLGLVGGGLAVRGATGYCPAFNALDIDTKEKSLLEQGKTKAKDWFEQKVEVVKSVTINKSAEELYSFWRNFENLPKFMNHLESVKVIDDKKSEWTAKAPLGYEAHWSAVITEEKQNEKIAWRSVENSQIPNSGKVEFLPTVDRGTVVKVTIRYEPPAGKLGALASYFLTEEPETQIAEDLRRFKSLMETGLVMQVEGQPSGRETEKAKAKTATA
ncbi:MAG: SRPBCC family protein [Pyrinomonadaceae bacterium]